MSKKAKSLLDAAERGDKTVNIVHLNRPVREAELKKALAELFETDYEIPDSAIEGKYARKIEQMEAQLKSLTHRLLEMQSKQDGKAPIEAGRVDAVAAVKAKKKQA